MASKPDINLYSFNGPEYNGRTVDMGGTVLYPPSEVSDTVKCSTGLTDFRLYLGSVHGGLEDALDINNRCCNLEIVAQQWVFDPGHSKLGFTIKGGSRNIKISGEVFGDPLVDIGNASDQSHDPTTGVHLNLRRRDGEPIRVRVLGGDLPTFEPGSGPYRYVFPWRSKFLRTIVTKTFLELRRHFPI